jgi:hypothetical protein
MNPPGGKFRGCESLINRTQKRDFVRPSGSLRFPVNRDRAYYRPFLRLELVPQCELHDSRVREQAAESSE